MAYVKRRALVLGVRSEREVAAHQQLPLAAPVRHLAHGCDWLRRVGSRRHPQRLGWLRLRLGGNSASRGRFKPKDLAERRAEGVA